MNLIRPLIAAGFVFAAIALARPGEAASPSPAPSPSATPAPSGFRYSGQIRSYYFVRQNERQNASNRNRTAFLTGSTLHAEYWLPATGLHVGTSYTGADPFGLNGPSPQTDPKIDNTLPGFALSTFDEAYVGYTKGVVDATLGNRFYNFIWMPSSDTRIKAAAYQGGDLNLKVLPDLEIGVSRILRFESRTASAFTANALLTSYVAGNSAPPTIANTPGALHLYAFATLPSATIRAESYSFFDLATLDYADTKVFVLPGSRYQPFVAAQFVDEHQLGRALLGRIANDTFGTAVGVNASSTVSLVFGLDAAPGHAATVFASSAAAAEQSFFLPAGGTPDALRVRKGEYLVAYGGLASPYSDSYTGDPLYTTSITQGFVERRSPGSSYKLTGTYVTPNRRFKSIVSAAYYDFDNVAGRNRTFQNDTDVQYFFNPVAATGPYHGLSVRERLAHRSQPTIPYDFKYIRTQLEYDF